MMRMRKNTTGMSLRNGGSNSDSGDGEAGSEWEVRPGGMLVQKRNSESDQNSVPAPIIRVRVKYGSTYHEVNISSQATFGELRKVLSELTGLHHQDQKLVYKDKERDPKEFLDLTGVKDKSKIVLLEDPISQEKRLLEMRKNAKMEKAAKSISEISLEVDRLAGRISALELVINKGVKVSETDVLNLIELLMNELLKLDGIIADGDVKLQRKMQVKRVQKYVETLDMLKIKNSMPSSNGTQTKVQNKQKHHHVHSLAPIHEEQDRYSRGHPHKPTIIQEDRLFELSAGDSHIIMQPTVQPSRHSTSEVVVTTNWETFDSAPALAPSTSTSRPTLVANTPDHSKLNWDFFN